jgi:hypothetical protein
LGEKNKRVGKPLQYPSVFKETDAPKKYGRINS